LPSDGNHSDHHDRLAACCRSIHTLLLDLPSDLAIVDTLDYLLGATYGLLKARKASFRNRPQAHLQHYEAHVAEYALNIACDKKPHHLWLAGYHFNSGIQRLAAVFDRFSLLLGQGGDKPARERMRAAVGPQPRWNKWFAAYKEINAFKHGVEGRGRGRELTFDDAVKGIEQAVQAFEAHKPALKTRYDGRNT
jgi:hypothetical protein